MENNLYKKANHQLNFLMIDHQMYTVIDCTTFSFWINVHCRFYVFLTFPPTICFDNNHVLNV